MSKMLVSLTEKKVRELLEWKTLVAAMELAFISVSKKTIDQKPRAFTHVLGSKNILLTMPVYVKTNKTAASSLLSCKTVTVFPNNPKKSPPLPSVIANICMFDPDTGKLKYILPGNEITAWRTAAASIVATNYLHYAVTKTEPNVVAIMGSGTQSRSHALGFHNILKYKEIRIWNYELKGASTLADELQKLGVPAKAFKSGKECVSDAEVIVTATYASNPIVEMEWIKPNVHINAVGAGINRHSELSKSIYKNSVIYVDSMDGAREELQELYDAQMITGELGEVIMGQKKPGTGKITIFHSLGMAVEDALVAKLIYDKSDEMQKEQI